MLPGARRRLSDSVGPEYGRAQGFGDVRVHDEDFAEAGTRPRPVAKKST
jgi:hypothetical protein